MTWVTTFQWRPTDLTALPASIATLASLTHLDVRHNSAIAYTDLAKMRMSNNRRQHDAVPQLSVLQRLLRFHSCWRMRSIEG